MFEVIPAIDLLDGKVVRLSQGDYNRVDYYDQYTPESLAGLYEDSGAKRIHIVDLNGAKDGKLVNLDAVKRIRASVSCKLELGGGIRSRETVKQLLDTGLDYIILGSLLIKSKDLAFDIIRSYPGRIIGGLDANDNMIAVEGWTESSNISVEAVLAELAEVPVASIIYTDISKDGMLTGPAVASLKKMAAITDIPVIASGGVSCIDDVVSLKALEHSGVSGCIIGKAVMTGKIDVRTLFSLQ
ncbi:MAG: 1-(5-phosphoribosyl)-5-[(5-phosphoribosylamino)methylideneamino]imidazole-4-carboxamide isomerase [bacterium]|nr:1-(5-phosphoribosyl)-5-[(5-phosphoribosylamino)methylideneamino]imidazole-4-carboxamide isomerase [bacterium]